MIRVLLRHRLRLWRNELLRGRDSVRRIAGLLFALAVLGFAYWGSRALFVVLAETSPSLPETLLPWLFAVPALGALFFGIMAILHQLYLASNLELLLAAPVPLPSLFALKLVDAFLATGLAGLAGMTAFLLSLFFVVMNLPMLTCLVPNTVEAFRSDSSGKLMARAVGSVFMAGASLASVVVMGVAARQAVKKLETQEVNMVGSLPGKNRRLTVRVLTNYERL